MPRQSLRKVHLVPYVTLDHPAPSMENLWEHLSETVRNALCTEREERSTDNANGLADGLELEWSSISLEDQKSAVYGERAMPREPHADKEDLWTNSSSLRHTETALIAKPRKWWEPGLKIAENALLTSKEPRHSLTATGWDGGEEPNQ